MRIALITCAYPPYRSGIGTAASRHAAHLTDLGHQVTVFCPAGHGLEGTQTVDGIRVRRLRPLIRHGNSAALPQLAWHVRGFDAVYIMWPFYGGAEPAAIGARINRIPYVVFFHMDVIWDGWRGAVLSAHARTAQPWIMRGADRVLVSSKELARASSLGAITGLELAASPYSIDLRRFHPDDEYRPLDDVPRVLFVGAMDSGHAFKGVPELISAFTAVHEHMPCRLELVGDGDLRRSFEELARNSEASSDIAFLGQVDDHGLVRAYQRAAVLVLPSTTREEAFGIVLVEAMACGCPVIASDFPGVDAVVRSGGGVLVPPGDMSRLAEAIERTISDPLMHANMRASALAGTQPYYPEAERSRLAATFSGLRSTR